MERLKVYTKEACMPCKATLRHLGKLGLDYSEVRIDGDVAEELRDQGFTESPVVDTGEEMWSGYRPDKLNELKDTP